MCLCVCLGVVSRALQVASEVVEDTREERGAIAKLREAVFEVRAPLDRPCPCRKGPVPAATPRLISIALPAAPFRVVIGCFR